MIKPRAGRSVSVVAAFLAVTLPAGLRAEVIDVKAGPGGLKAALAAARPGAVLRLLPGEHPGPIRIDKAVSLTGAPGAKVTGDGSGSVLRIAAPDVAVRTLAITGSGKAGEALDAGIHVEKAGDRVVIEDNTLDGNLYGVVLQGPKSAVVRNNRIANRGDVWLNHRGDGVSVWRSSGAVIEGNVVTGGRDGIFINVADGNIIRNNRFTDLRFAVHYMYANNNQVTDNVSMNNHVGYALMYSERLRALRNVSLNDDQHGLMFHTSYRSEVAHNFVKGTKDKCVFIYTSAQNGIHDNRFEGCGIGVHYAGGAQDNRIWGNAFIDNGTQVKYAGTTLYDWSKDGQGNYWSDNPAFDLNGDGRADVPYRPNDIIDRVVWNFPLAKLLLSSQAVETLRFVQRQMPALYPGGVVDTAPLMAPPPPPVALPARTG